MKLLVRNLSRDILEADIKPLFEKFGEVQSCVLVVDQRTGGSKGFGFVEMSNDEEAKAALEALHNSKVKRSLMKVKESVAKEGDSDTKSESEKDPDKDKEPDKDLDKDKEPEADAKPKITVDRSLLYNVTLEEMLTCLVTKYGWKGLNFRIELNCFRNDPSISSSVTFLRKEYWAQKKVETLYLSMDKADRVDKAPYKEPEKPKLEPKPESKSNSKPSVWDKARKKHKND